MWGERPPSCNQGKNVHITSATTSTSGEADAIEWYYQRKKNKKKSREPNRNAQMMEIDIL